MVDSALPKKVPRKKKPRTYKEWEAQAYTSDDLYESPPGERAPSVFDDGTGRVPEEIAADNEREAQERRDAAHRKNLKDQIRDAKYAGMMPH